MIEGARLEIARGLLEAAAREMGVTLQRSAFSPNIKERRDASSALFDAEGRLLAEAEHIPVHLGAMPASVAAALARFPEIAEGDVILLNDPYRGGTHLPDITMIAPVFLDGVRIGFAANRAHHADVGGSVPGSMPAASREIFEEGLVLPPVKLLEGGRMNDSVLEILLTNVRTPAERHGDLRAQLSANAVGARRIQEIARRDADFPGTAAALLDASERLTAAALSRFPEGEAVGVDFLEGDGIVEDDLPVRVRVRISDARIDVDFSGTARQSAGNVNAPLPVAEAATLYVVRALLPREIMPNAGVARRVTTTAPPGSLLNPRPPAAVAAGNVETSQRTVDALLRAFAGICPDRVPAASQGTMNNITIGGPAWTYYETLGGGEGGHPRRAGMSGVHTHMTNTRNTPIEALEHAYPLRIRAYRLRTGSGGRGRRPGGEGLVRETEVLCDEAVASLLTDRRRRGPWGLSGGSDGAPGRNVIIRAGETAPLPSKGVVRLRKGDRLRIDTPGGGGYGPP
ncbi:MAG: hydantoinase B/oxoprolinase family protein [Methanobacteriota archaeon]